MTAAVQPMDERQPTGSTGARTPTRQLCWVRPVTRRGRVEDPSRSPDEESPVAQQHFDRLTALDASFLAQEGGKVRAPCRPCPLRGSGTPARRVRGRPAPRPTSRPAWSAGSRGRCTANALEPGLEGVLLPLAMLRPGRRSSATYCATDRPPGCLPTARKSMESALATTYPSRVSTIPSSWWTASPRACRGAA